MAIICHGQGDSSIGGCCWIDGQVCSHRWFIDYSFAADRTDTRNAHIIDGTGADLGTVDAYVKSVHNGKPRQDRVVDVIQGRDFVCGVLGVTVAADGIPTGANWEADFEQAWSDEYEAGGVAEDVGDSWASQGRPRNWCVSFGPGEGHCCFKESQEDNDAKALNISDVSVAVASRPSMTGG